MSAKKAKIPKTPQPEQCGGGEDRFRVRLANSVQLAQNVPSQWMSIYVVADGEVHAEIRFELAELTGRRVLELPMKIDASLAEPMVPGLRYLLAEAVYAVRQEMATSLIDVLTRRTRAHLEHRAACLAAANELATALAPEFGWSADDVIAQVDAYRQLCDDEFAAADHPDARHAEAAP